MRANTVLSLYPPNTKFSISQQKASVLAWLKSGDTIPT